MPCKPIDLGNAVTGIACTRGARRPKCQTPGCGRDSAIQCDYPVTRKGTAGTCDRHQCRQCAVRVGDNLDYCGVHARMKK